MKKNVKQIILSAVAAAAVAAALTGCGQARSEGGAAGTKTTDAPIVKVTEKITEAPQTETEPQTPAPQTETQPQTPAPQTETPAPQTETPAQPQTTATPLSKEEEVAQETEYQESKTMWASDNVNVREMPTTDEDNIFSSLDQGQTATVIGETPNWYEISVPYTDDDGTTQENVGFVSKQFLSDTEVQPKTDEEIAAAAAGETAQAAPADTAAEAAPAADSSSADQQAAASAAPASGPTVTIASDANIRSDASQTADVVGVVSAGEKVTVIGDVDGWYQVDYNGVQGYVNKNLVG